MNVKPVFFSLIFLLLMGNFGISQTIKTDTVYRDLNTDGRIDKLVYENYTLTEFWQNTGKNRYTLHYSPTKVLKYSPEMFIPANPDSQYFADETATRLPVVSDASFRCDIGDVDNDNDLDIIVANLEPRFEIQYRW